jgi:uncharacterized protein (TIGR02246 family)
MSQADIAAVNRQFEAAIRKGDGAAISALYTADAIVMPPDGPFVKGRTNIAQMWSGAIQQMDIKDVTLSSVELEVNGDVATEVGEAVLALASSTAVVKYVVVWRRVDGRWYLHRDIWNTKAT